MFGFGSLASQLFTSMAAVAVAIGVFQVSSIAPSSPPASTFEWDQAFSDPNTDWRTSLTGLGDAAAAWKDKRAKMEDDMLVLEDYLTRGDGSR
jgi:hypothetical protein